MPSRNDPDQQALDDALASLGREIRTRFTARESRPAPWEEIDWPRLYDEARRRLQRFGVAERSGHVDEFGMDDAVVAQARTLFDFLFETWWRVDLSGVETLPAEGPVLFVSNRSGILPYDGLMLSYALARFHPSLGRARFLIADWLITLPFVQPYLARLGGVRACRENAEHLLERGRSVIAFPEGVKGAAKMYRDRYRLQRFGRGGVVRLALDLGVPLVPIGVVGAEEAHPVLYKSVVPARAVGLPFVPVTPTFPWLGPLGALPLPSKWVVRIGEPIALDHLSSEREDELLVARLNAELRERIQSLVDVALADRAAVFG